MFSVVIVVINPGWPIAQTCRGSYRHMVGSGRYRRAGTKVIGMLVIIHVISE